MIKFAEHVSTLIALVKTPGTTYGEADEAAEPLMNLLKEHGHLPHFAAGYQIEWESVYEHDVLRICHFPKQQTIKNPEPDPVWITVKRDGTVLKS